MQKIHLAVVLLAGALLAACGGRSVSGAAGGDSGGGTTPPTVASTSPTDNATYVGTGTTISVTFSKAMNPLTVKAVTGGTDCSTNSPTLQVSSNNFATCVPMTSATPTTSDNITFTMTPSSPLNTATTYKIRVTTGVQDSFGNALASQFETTNGFTTNPTQPNVTSTTPADSATGFDPFTGTITIHFSTTMNRSSATFNAAAGTCTGNIQVSADNFTNCIGVSIPAGNASSFTLTPTAPLLSATTYKVKVLSTLTDTSANAVSQFVHSNGITTRYYRTEAIDGTNNFVAGETFATSSGGYTAYITWDNTNVYIGYSGTDVNSNVATKWVLIYIGDSAGSSTGITYNTQTPTFPTGFNAKYHIRWKATNDYTNAQVYSTSWSDAVWDFTGKVYKLGNYVEFRIPRADIGSPTTLKVIVNMINEQGGGEWTYGLAPSTGFTDGQNQSPAKFLSCDLNSSSAPTTSCSILP